MTATAFIFARGGSKGLLGKNIRPLNGRSTVARAVDAAKAVPSLDKVIVSTDDLKIAEEAKSAGAEVPFLRPAELAGDQVGEWQAWRHALEQVPETELFVSVPPTAPLRLPQDIQACLDRFHQGGVDIVVTATAARHHPAFNMVALSDDGFARLAQPGTGFVRRQDAPSLYDMTTVAYVADPDFIRRSDRLFDADGGGRVGLVVVPEERAVDIDTALDWDLAELLLKRREGEKDKAT